MTFTHLQNRQIVAVHFVLSLGVAIAGLVVTAF